MFKRIKVITVLIVVLVALGAMQLISAGVFVRALNNDKQNFTVSQLSSQNVAEFTDAWISLNQARVTLNRGMLRLQGTMASSVNGGELQSVRMRQDGSTSRYTAGGLKKGDVVEYRFTAWDNQRQLATDSATTSPVPSEAEACNVQR